MKLWLRTGFCGNMKITMNPLKAKDEVIIQTATEQYRATIMKVSDDGKEILAQRHYSKEVSTTLWVPISSIIKHKSN